MAVNKPTNRPKTIARNITIPQKVTHVSKLKVGHEATNGGGDTSFTCAGTVGVLIPGQKVTATASNTSGTATGTAIGDTSEFSENVLVS